MELYTMLREFADSWFLIAMFVFFVGTWVYAFWPTQHRAREDAASIPLRDDQTKCSGTCDGCPCKRDVFEEASNG